MANRTPSTLIERLETLERAQRRSTQYAAALALAVAALLLMGHSVVATKLVSGDQITLRTAGGITRGELSIEGDGGARFVLYDPGRTPRAELVSRPPDGAPVLTLYDKRWAPRLSLRLDQDGAPHIELYDKAGKTIWAAP